MAADLGLLKLAQAQQQSNPSLTTGSWMWNSRRAQEEDDSWEVRAFAEDTGNVMGTTWPPRSYTCTFCRREFRSAQALGGHMNVHRRDRARLRQSSPGSADPSSSSTSSSALIFPTQEFASNGGLCLLYPLPSPNGVFNSTSFNGYIESPSTLLSISPYPTNSLMSSCPPVTFPMATSIHAAPLCHSGEVQPTVSADNDDNNFINGNDSNNIGKGFSEELDLELRLGSRPSP